MPVIRVLLWLLGAVLLGGIVHLATVLLIPVMPHIPRQSFDALLHDLRLV